VNALFVALLTIGTAISCVVLGVFGAYASVTGILAALDPERTERALPTFVGQQSQLTGD